MLAYRHGESVVTEPLDLGSAVERNMDILRAAVTADIGLELTLEQDLPPVMLSDSDLGQLLLNLCLNARDAMRGRGTLRIDICRRRDVEVECSDCHRCLVGDWVELAVIDQGEGIPESVQSRMFEPFFTTKDVGEGTGMGLSVVRGVLNRNAAHVVVDTAAGRGTSFRLLFRPAIGLAATPLAAGTEVSFPEIAGAGQQIVVVDDEPDVLSYLVEALTDGGYRVLSFGSPVEAARHLVAAEQAPGMSGTELAERARRRFPELPIIVLSGVGSDDVLRQSELNAVRFLGKPIDLDRLLAEVGLMLRSSDDEDSKAVSGG